MTGKWSGVPERRHRDEMFSVAVVHDSSEWPEIGDEVLVTGRKGAQWHGLIEAIRERGHRKTYVFTTQPPWATHSAAQLRALNEIEAVKEAARVAALAAAGLCPECEEPAPTRDAPCRCGRRALARHKERLAAAVAEAAEAERLAKVRRDRKAARQANARILARLTVEAVRNALTEHNGTWSLAAESLGLKVEPRTKGHPRRLGPMLIGWSRRAANLSADLVGYAKQLRDKADKEVF